MQKAGSLFENRPLTLVAGRDRSPGLPEDRLRGIPCKRFGGRLRGKARYRASGSNPEERQRSRGKGWQSQAAVSWSVPRPLQLADPGAPHAAGPGAEAARACGVAVLALAEAGERGPELRPGGLAPPG